MQSKELQLVVKELPQILYRILWVAIGKGIEEVAVSSWTFS